MECSLEVYERESKMVGKSDAGLVIVTPVYEDREAAEILFVELKKCLAPGFRVVVVDDGSIARPISISSLLRSGVSGTLIKLKRNVGHQRAIAIGMCYVADQMSNVTEIVVMDSDGEDAPNTIIKLHQQLHNNVDLVVAERGNRIETFKFRLFYLVYKLLFRALVGRSIKFGNFMIMTHQALERLVSHPELWIHLASTVLISKLTIAGCPIDRGPRYIGKSRMNFVSLTLHGFRALMVFAEDVLVRVGIACSFIALLALGGGGLTVLLKLMGVTTPGWASVVLGLLIVVFLQTGTMTLITLMLTGVVKSSDNTLPSYGDFVSEITSTNSAEVGLQREKIE